MNPQSTHQVINNFLSIFPASHKAEFKVCTYDYYEIILSYRIPKEKVFTPHRTHTDKNVRCPK